MSTRTRILGTTTAGAALALLLSGCFSFVPVVDEVPEPSTSSESTETDTPTVGDQKPIDGDEVGAASFDNGLDVTIYNLGEGVSAADSNFVKDDGTTTHPAGSREIALAYLVTNNSDAAIDVSAFSQTGAFESSQYFAVQDSTQDAVNLTLGYERTPVEAFGGGGSPWLLEPGASVYWTYAIMFEDAGAYLTNISVAGESISRLSVTL